MAKRNFLLIALSAWIGGCLDFVEPDFSSESNNATFQVSALQNQRGRLVLFGTLTLGIDRDGFRREVENDTIVVNTQRVGPSRIAENQTRSYDHSQEAMQAEQFTVVAPLLENVERLPTVSWPTVRKSGGDTISIARGEPLRLTVTVGSTAPQPTRPTQQWQVEIVGSSARFFVGGSGSPPPVIEVSPSFIPPAPDSIVAVGFRFTQSDVVQVSSYTGVYNYSQELNWTVLIR